MKLSVVVPTLNGRDRLRGCLDSLADHAPDAEVVVANGPSADGTTGMVRDRDDVDVLVEVADRNVNVARNAGIAAAEGDAVALVGYDLVVEPSWRTAIGDALDRGVDAVTGPTRRAMRVGMATESEDADSLAGRSVTYFNADNVAFTREALSEVDGFDEYLETGGARDCSHRLAGIDRQVEWDGEMAVRSEYGADGGTGDRDRDWNWSYRSFAYRLAKSYGLRPAVARRVASRAVSDCGSSARGVVEGETPVSTLAGNVRSVLTGTARGIGDGIAARFRDRRPRRNPNGISSRFDRVVEAYDWR